jgi:hypothetical protein
MASDETKSGQTRSESREPSVDAALEQEVMRALLDPDKLSVDEIEELLMRCAAETLRLQADRKRAESTVRELEAERVRLFELTADVRALRDRAKSWYRNS